MQFKDKRIVLTGAAGGIGEALARQLASEGARLALADLNEEGLQKVGQMCQELGSEVITIPTDVTQLEQCQALISKAVETWGGLDVFLSNAGLSMWSRFEDVTDISIFERILAVNYFGPLYCTYAALPYLRESKGMIVAITSSSGKLAAPLHSGYAASKHAMHGFFDSLRTELVGTGVTITLSVPLFVATRIRFHGYQGDGTHPDQDPYDDTKSMTAEEAARITLKAARKRRREVVMTLELKAGVKLRPFIPRLVEHFSRQKVGLKT
ncbi:MAG: SDR family oxidoreductase [Fidelibacterota bacterium]|nr:MAG: SDR family oxidoreductase [Candidatus Neomarinimicrobiota bacterium]